MGDRWVVASTDVAPGADVLVEIPSGTGKMAQVLAQTPCDEELHALSEPFPIAPSQKVTTYRWDRVTESPAFPTMDGAGAVTFGGRMWLLGGWHWDTSVMPRRTSNAVWSSADGVHWQQVKPNTYDESFAETVLDWEGRHTAGYGVLGGQLVIAGGDGTSGGYQADVWTSRDGATWEMRTARSPLDERLLFQTFVLGQRMCAYGGQTIPSIVASPERYYDDLWCTTDGRSWSEMAPDGPRPFQRSGILGQAVLNGEVWILGGGRYEWPASPLLWWPLGR